MNKYEITAISGRKTIIEAASSQQAKRMACKHWGLKPSCPWTGIRAMKARKIKEEERS